MAEKRTANLEDLFYRDRRNLKSYGIERDIVRRFFPAIRNRYEKAETVQ